MGSEEKLGGRRARPADKEVGVGGGSPRGVLGGLGGLGGLARLARLVSVRSDAATQRRRLAGAHNGGLLVGGGQSKAVGICGPDSGRLAVVPFVPFGAPAPVG